MSNEKTHQSRDLVFVYDEDGLFEVKNDSLSHDLSGGSTNQLEQAPSGWGCSNSGASCQ